MITVIEFSIAGTKVFGTLCDTSSGAERFAGFVVAKSKIVAPIDADSVLAALESVDPSISALAADPLGE
jgi:hypothetical protein